jgi:hypothetical protein
MMAVLAGSRADRDRLEQRMTGMKFVMPGEALCGMRFTFVLVSAEVTDRIRIGESEAERKMMSAWLDDARCWLRPGGVWAFESVDATL